MEALANDKVLKALIIVSVVMSTASALITIVKYLEEKEAARKSSNQS